MVDFTDMGIATVESTAGQNFTYNPSDGLPGGTVNVRLDSEESYARDPRL